MAHSISLTAYLCHIINSRSNPVLPWWFRWCVMCLYLLKWNRCCCAQLSSVGLYSCFHEWVTEWLKPAPKGSKALLIEQLRKGRHMPFPPTANDLLAELHPTRPSNFQFVPSLPCLAHVPTLWPPALPRIHPLSKVNGFFSSQLTYHTLSTVLACSAATAPLPCILKESPLYLSSVAPLQ